MKSFLRNLFLKIKIKYNKLRYGTGLRVNDLKYLDDPELTEIVDSLQDTVEDLENN